MHCWFFCDDTLFRKRRIDNEAPEPCEEELEQEPDVYEPEETHAYYIPGKQLPLDHVEPMFIKCVLIAKTCMLCFMKCYVLSRVAITHLVVEVGFDILLSL